MEKYLAGLAEQAEQLNSVRSILQFGVFTCKCDEDFTIITIDEHFSEMFGYTKKELMEICHGKAGELIYAEDYKDTVASIFEQCDKTGEYSCQYRVRKRDGTFIWVWDTGVREKNENGQKILRGIIANINLLVNWRRERDVTYENIPGGVAYIDIFENDFTIRDANDNFFAMLGVDKKEYLAENIRYTDPDDLPRLREHFSKQAQKTEPIDIEFRAKVPKGNKTKWFRIVGRFYARELDCIEYLCIMTDTTERRETLALLAHEKERYQIAMKSTADIVYEYDVLKDELTIYPGLIKKPDSILAEKGTYADWREKLFENHLIHPDDQAKIKKVIKSKEHHVEEVRVLLSDDATGEKEYRWFDVHATGILDKKNRLVQVVGVLQDVKDKKEQLDLRTKLEPFLISQLTKSYERVFVVDLKDGTYRLFSGEKGDFYSIKKSGNHEERMKMMAEKFVYKEDKERYLFSLKIERMLELLNSGEEEVNRFFRVLGPNGEYRWKCYRYSYYNMNMDKILFSVQDIHDIRMEEQKTEESTRRILLNALEEAKKASETRRNFITMITEEIKQPLLSIQKMSKLQPEEMKDQVRVKAHLDDIQQAATFMLKIVGDVTELSQLDKGIIHMGREKINLYQLIMEILAEQKMIAMKNQVNIVDYIRIPRERNYYGDEFRVRQVIGNVLANSVRFSPKGESVKILVSEESGKKGMAKITISIEDMGVHINEENFERIYSEDKRSLFSKESRIMENTGFSIMLCKEIAELMDGNVEVTNGNRGENYFRIQIPLEPMHEQNASEKMEMKETAKQEEDKIQVVDLSPYSILLVQNDSNRNQLLSSLLKINGAKVEVAETVREAFSIWNIYTGGGFQAILVDTVLPDMDGMEFASLIRESNHPDAKTVPIILMSDNVVIEDMKRAYQMGINGSLSKPIDMHQLLQILQAVNGGLIK